jgi:nucleoside-diphosphate-sugar epimerase
LKALITGGAGALGSRLVKMLLQKGYSVSVYEVLQKDLAWRLTEVMDDIRYVWKSTHDMGLYDVDEYQLICFCSAQPDRPFGISSPYTTMWMNLMGLVRVLEASVASEALKHFIFPSSATPFVGVGYDELPCVESTIPKPTNPYAASKYMGEILVDTYRRCYNLPSTIIRSGMVYGPGMRLDVSIAQFIKHALNGEEFQVRSPYATRTPTYIDDALLYWDAVIRKRPIGEIFHSVYGNEYSIIDIAETVVSVVQKGKAKPYQSYEAGENLGRHRPVREWVISTKDQQLGVRPVVSLRSGIEKTIPYIFQQLFL